MREGPLVGVKPAKDIRDHCYVRHQKHVWKQEDDCGPGSGCGDLDAAEIAGISGALGGSRRLRVAEEASVLLSQASDLEHCMSTCVRTQSPQDCYLGHFTPLGLSSL